MKHLYRITVLLAVLSFLFAGGTTNLVNKSTILDEGDTDGTYEYGLMIVSLKVWLHYV
jgi:hypothetical protein